MLEAFFYVYFCTIFFFDNNEKNKELLQHEYEENWIGYTKLDKKDKGTLHKKMEEIIMPFDEHAEFLQTSSNNKSCYFSMVENQELL